jgi:hypothetical protein
MERFIGTWKNKSGNTLEIKPYDKKSLKVTFISGKTGKPVNREFFENKDTVEMRAILDIYETSIRIDLGTRDMNFELFLYHSLENHNISLDEYSLAPSFSQLEKDDFFQKYGDLFEPLENYFKEKHIL